MPEIKYIVYNYVIEVLFSSDPTTNITAESIASSLDDQMKVKICAFLNPLILEIRNRLPSIPLTKSTLNKAPFDIFPTLRYILQCYESIIAEHQQAQIEQAQREEQNVQLIGPSNRRRRRPKKRKKIKKHDSEVERNKNKNQSQPPAFQPPRLFSLFPNPGFQWRFIKVDSQNIAGIFGKSAPKQTGETIFNFAQRCFHENFDFKKLRINR